MCGRVSRMDALKHHGAGNPCLNFSLASNTRLGQDKQETCYLDCVAWGKTAEMAAKYLSQGREVLVEGRLKQESWSDKSGQTRSKHVCVVSNIELGAIPKAQQGAGGGYQQRNSNSGGYNQGAAYNDSNSQTSEPLADEDIPF